MTSLLLPTNHAPRLLYATLAFIAALSVVGCATPAADLRVMPDGLDFDYTVSSDGGHGVMRAFGDQGKTILVLDQPLQGGLKSVRIELPGGIRSSADVRGNYILVPGRPERFIVNLPSGAVEVERSTALAISGRGRNVLPSNASPQAADDGAEHGAGEGADESDEVESNLDWGATDGSRAAANSTLDQGGPVPGRPGHDGEQRRGPLPTSVEQLR